MICSINFDVKVVLCSYRVKELSRPPFGAARRSRAVIDRLRALGEIAMSFPFDWYQPRMFW
jgi:hypothetical protein